MEPKACVQVIYDALAQYPIKRDRREIAKEITARQSSGHCFFGRTENGFLLARTEPVPFGRGHVATLEFVHSQRAGDGIALIRQFCAWCDKRPAIKWAVWTPLFSWDARFERVMGRMGFVRRGGCFERMRVQHGIF